MCTNSQLLTYLSGIKKDKRRIVKERIMKKYAEKNSILYETNGEYRSSKLFESRAFYIILHQHKNIDIFWLALYY